MGHPSFEELSARAEANNYNYGEQSCEEIAHSKGHTTYTSKTTKDQDCYLKLYAQ